MHLPVFYILNIRDSETTAPWLAAISARSLRIQHPQAQIHLLADSASRPWLAGSFARVAESFDSVRLLETDHTDPVASNRFLKTRLPEYARGPGVYLDNDTLVVGRLDALDSLDCDFAACPDVQSVMRRPGLPDRYEPLYRKLGWNSAVIRYLNGGVFYFNDTPGAARFFKSWHERWTRCVAEGHLVDQPALNSLWQETDARIAVLPSRYNALIEVSEGLARRAKIYHYTTSYARLSQYVFPELIASLRRGDPIGPELDSVVTSRYVWSDPTHAKRWWLTGHPARALGIAIRKRLLKPSRQDIHTGNR